MPVFLRPIVALALVACIASSQAQGHGMRKGGNLLRSSTASSDQIDPATAEKHGTTPASNRAVLNALVLRRSGAARQAPCRSNRGRVHGQPGGRAARHWTARGW